MATLSSGPASGKGGFAGVHPSLPFNLERMDSRSSRAAGSESQKNKFILGEARVRSEPANSHRVSGFKLPPIMRTSDSSRQSNRTTARFTVNRSLGPSLEGSREGSTHEATAVARVHKLLQSNEGDPTEVLDRQRLRLNDLFGLAGGASDSPKVDVLTSLETTIWALKSRVKERQSLLERLSKLETASMRRIDKSSGHLVIKKEISQEQLCQLIKKELEKKGNLIEKQASLMDQIQKYNQRQLAHQSPHPVGGSRGPKVSITASSPCSPGVELFSRPKRKVQTYSARLQHATSPTSYHQGSVGSSNAKTFSRLRVEPVVRALFEGTADDLVQNREENTRSLRAQHHVTSTNESPESTINQEINNLQTLKAKPRGPVDKARAMQRINDVRETLSTKKIEYLAAAYRQGGNDRKASFGVNTHQETVRDPETPQLDRSDRGFKDLFPLQGAFLANKPNLNETKRRNKTLEEGQISQKTQEVVELECSAIEPLDASAFRTPTVVFGRSLRKGSDGKIHDFMKNRLHEDREAKVVRGLPKLEISKPPDVSTEPVADANMKLNPAPQDRSAAEDTQKQVQKESILDEVQRPRQVSNSATSGVGELTSPGKDFLNFLRAGGLSQVTKGMSSSSLQPPEPRSNSLFSFNGLPEGRGLIKLEPVQSDRIQMDGTENQLQVSNKTGPGTHQGPQVIARPVAPRKSSSHILTEDKQFLLHGPKSHVYQAFGSEIARINSSEVGEAHEKQDGANTTIAESPTEIRGHSTSKFSKKPAVEATGRKSLFDNSNQEITHLRAQNGKNHEKPRGTTSKGHLEEEDQRLPQKTSISEKKNLRLISEMAQLPNNTARFTDFRRSQEHLESPESLSKRPLGSLAATGQVPQDAVPSYRFPPSRPASRQKMDKPNKPLYDFFKIEEKSLEDVSLAAGVVGNTNQVPAPPGGTVSDRPGDAASSRLIPESQTKILDTISESKSSRRLLGSSVWLNGIPGSKKSIKPRFDHTDDLPLRDESRSDLNRRTENELRRQKSNLSKASRLSEALRRLIPGDMENESRRSSSDSQDSRRSWGGFAVRYPSKPFLQESEDG